MLRGVIKRPLVVIPAYNERPSIAGVIAGVRASQPGLAILVVDDASTDGTAEVARSAEALVLTLPINLGVGGAMRTGFKYAVRNGHDAVIQVDADGQHDPRFIQPMLELAAEGRQVVIGARFAGVGDYEVRGPRRWAMRLFARVLSRSAGTRLTDVTSGFRVTSGAALPFFARDFPEEYLGDTLESLVMAARLGLTIGQVPVAMHARAHGSPSQSWWRATAYLARATLVLVLAQWHRIPSAAIAPASGAQPATEHTSTEAAS